MADEFRFFKLGLGSRLALSGGLYAAGLGLQLALGGSIFPGILLGIAGWFPLMLKPATNRPEDQGLEEWRAVTMAEIDRIDDGIRASRQIGKKVKSAKAGKAQTKAGKAKASPLGCLIPLAFFGLIGLFAQGRLDALFYVANAFVIFLPAIAFGRVRVFIPPEISFKLPSFRAFLSEPLPEGIAVAPYLRFDKDKEGLDVPEDLRIMLELKRPPADLVGVQVQAAVNKGPNGNVPYLYAVVLTKGSGGAAYKAARGAKRRGFEVEPGADGEFGTVVIRQGTSSGGYHTTADDCRELRRFCDELLGSMRRSAGKIGAAAIY